MTELALDHNERDALMRHLNSVGMAQLMRREPPPHTRTGCGAGQLFAGCGLLPALAGGRAADHTQQRAHRQLTPSGHPRLQLRPRPPIHSDLPTAATLTAAHQNRTTRCIEVRLGQIQRLADP
jgi:hypothetical protein